MAAGLALAVIWFNQTSTPVPEKAAAVAKPAVLVAAAAVSTGSLLRADDIAWKEVGPGEMRAGDIVRGQISESEFVGALARRDFSTGERLVAADLVRPNERQFLAAVLKPGMRAVSITVDASQGASGLARPGDRVDVVLTQNYPTPTQPTDLHRSIGETVLRNVTVIAIDQSLSAAVKTDAPNRPGVTAEARGPNPKTVTLELSESQAEVLFVASQQGRLSLSVRSLQQPSPGQAAESHTGTSMWLLSGSPVTSTIRWAPLSR
ncbi:MAG TPA: Flp pilus assembly protein CpaB [Pseudolabrys sp.]|nr:Flp pilus assembly protein CpaB [Pseudolabrys sp.]